MAARDLSTEELRDLVFNSGEITNEEDLTIRFKSRYELDNVLSIDTVLYNCILEEARKENKSPVYICSTPVGIWRFNLEFFKAEEGMPKVYLNTAKATPMLPWYPTYDSEEEWIAEQMIEYGNEEPYVDDLELLIEEMINGEVDFDNEQETNE
jgi:hypothetical protein